MGCPRCCPTPRDSSSPNSRIMTIRGSCVNVGCGRLLVRLSFFLKVWKPGTVPREEHGRVPIVGRSLLYESPNDRRIQTELMDCEANKKKEFRSTKLTENNWTGNNVWSIC
ncbi:hypothetical protein Nepgr_003292 [Nepenthes gracilis]|uniref:Uncharacterized protein n=1 Tax=Nepenthes gracilis TaxID=150966 RepID=A0AAD3XDB6_NEPGR|nr:hypothetical protein Nepgr_003292 [Nepenthes gracilis]